MNGDLIGEYWEQVERDLRERYAYSELGARKALEAYRDRMVSHGALEAVYHWEPSDIARAISGQGYLATPLQRD